MKRIQKVVTNIVISILAIVAITATSTMHAFAQDQSVPKQTTITINGNGQDLTGRSFVGYRVLNIIGIGSDGTVTAEVNSQYRSALQETVAAQKNIDQATLVSDADIISYISDLHNNADQTRNFVDALSKTITGNSDITFSVNASSATATGTPGWYLIKETTAEDTETPFTDKNQPVSLVMASGTSANTTINIKSESPTSEKKIVRNPGKTEVLVDADDYGIGDDIVYQLTFTIPAEWATQYSDGFWFTMKDTLGTGLAYVDSPAPTISADGIDTASMPTSNFTKIVPTDNASNTQLVWDFQNKEKNKALAGKTVTIRYHAKLTHSAKIAAAGGNENSFYVRYQHNPYNDGDGSNTPEDKVYVYTYALNVFKYASESDTKTPLSGAEFTLTKNGKNNPIRFADNKPSNDSEASPTLTTGNEGYIKLSGLDAGTYILTETKAPNGYQKLGKPITITIAPKLESDVADIAKSSKATNGTALDTLVNNTKNGNVEVENKKGFLPNTGAAGIIGIVAAGLLLVAAGVFNLMRKRN